MTKREITFSEAIERVMLANGYYASLQLIYKEFEKYRSFSGLTPLKTIQERVQRDKRFTKIGLGVYALTRYLYKLPRFIEPKTPAERRSYTHTKIEGMIIEIGNMDGFDTYTPDKSKVFENKKLANLITTNQFPEFTFKQIIDSVQYIDVIWFNKRGFPEKVFEVEDSTDFRGSLVKFTELQDFKTHFNLIADSARKTKFEREISKSAFQNIANRCNFIDYGQVEELYSARLNYHKISREIAL